MTQNPYAEAPPDTLTEPLPAVRLEEHAMRDKRQHAEEERRNRRALREATKAYRETHNKDGVVIDYVGHDVAGRPNLEPADSHPKMTFANTLGALCAGLVAAVVMAWVLGVRL